MKYLLSTVAILILVGGAGCDKSVPKGSSSSGGAATGPATAKPEQQELLNVSYDPTRELYQDINQLFAKHYLEQHNVTVEVNQSHGGSSSQARAVIEGLDADVVTLALSSDTDMLRKKKLIDDDWQDRLPNKSLPYYSTIVFVVRAGNPKKIHDWTDLVQPGVEIITPNPITGGGAKLNFLAAWGSVVLRGGTKEKAREFLTQLYRQVPVLDSGARGSASTFVSKGIGDVHLAWENEAHREVAETPGKLEVIYPPLSIRAEPRVAVVDANARRKGTEKLARDYLEFLYTDAAQEVIAKQFYRPFNEEIGKKYSERLAPIELFEITAIAKDWDDAFETYFGKSGVYEAIVEELGTTKPAPTK